jgi:hypothetical protein
MCSNQAGKESQKKKIFRLNNSSQPKNKKMSDLLGPAKGTVGPIGKNERVSNASVSNVCRNSLRAQQDFSPNTTIKTYSNSTTKANLFLRRGTTGKGENFTQKSNQTVYNLKKKSQAIESWSPTNNPKNIPDPSFELDRPKLKKGFPHKSKARNKLVER